MRTMRRTRRHPEGSPPVTDVTDVTRTKEFRRWFGDSKVVDERGRPLVVWHGSPRNVDPFYVFDFDRAIDLGMHFGTAASAFDVIGTRSSYAMHPTSPLWRHVRPFYLSLQHPVFLSDPGDWISQPYGGVAVPTLEQLFSRGIIDEEQYQQAYEKVLAVREGPGKEQDVTKRRVLVSAIVRDAIIDAGYDGVKYTNESEDVGSTSWAAFFPEQIKLADGTNTTFDWKSPDVRRNPPKKRLTYARERPDGPGPDRLRIVPVDGERVRRDVDVDFTMGGNPSRYAYVPQGELWIGDNLSPPAAISTIVHESVEHRLMKHEGLSYDDAHEAANGIDAELRHVVDHAMERAPGRANPDARITEEEARKKMKGEQGTFRALDQGAHGLCTAFEYPDGGVYALHRRRDGKIQGHYHYPPKEWESPRAFVDESPFAPRRNPRIGKMMEAFADLLKTKDDRDPPRPFIEDGKVRIDLTYGKRDYEGDLELDILRMKVGRSFVAAAAGELGSRVFAEHNTLTAPKHRGKGYMHLLYTTLLKDGIGIVSDRWNHSLPMRKVWMRLARDGWPVYAFTDEGENVEGHTMTRVPPDVAQDDPLLDELLAVAPSKEAFGRMFDEYDLDEGVAEHLRGGADSVYEGDEGDEAEDG